MRGPERVVFTFGPLGKAGNTVPLTERMHLIAPAGQEFYADNTGARHPRSAVSRRVKNVMQRHRQFNHTQRCPKMATGNGDRSHGIVRNFVGKLAQFVHRQVSHVGRQFDLYPEVVVICTLASVTTNALFLYHLSVDL